MPLHDEAMPVLCWTAGTIRLGRDVEVALLPIPLQPLGCCGGAPTCSRFRFLSLDYPAFRVALRGARRFVAASTLASSAAIRSRPDPRACRPLRRLPCRGPCA